jgi:hypothetical protein
MDLFFELNKQLLQEGDVIGSDEFAIRRAEKAVEKAAKVEPPPEDEYSPIGSIDQELYDTVYEQIHDAFKLRFGRTPNRIEVHNSVRNYFHQNSNFYTGYDPKMEKYFLLKARDHETPDMINNPKINRRAFKRVYEQYVRENPEIRPNEAAYQVMLMYLDSNYQMDFEGSMDVNPDPAPPPPEETEAVSEPVDTPLPDNVVPFRRKG